MPTHMQHSSKAKFSVLEVIELARASVPQNIAQAMKCAAKIESGRSCTVAEMKATVRLLKQGLTGARATARAAKTAASEAKDMLQSVLSRVGL